MTSLDTESTPEEFIEEVGALTNDSEKAAFLAGGLVGYLSAYQKSSRDLSETLESQYPVSSVTQSRIYDLVSSVLDKHDEYSEDEGYTVAMNYAELLRRIMPEEDPVEWDMTNAEIRWYYSFGIAYGKNDYDTYRELENKISENPHGSKEAISALVARATSMSNRKAEATNALHRISHPSEYPEAIETHIGEVADEFIFTKNFDRRNKLMAILRNLCHNNNLLALNEKVKQAVANGLELYDGEQHSTIRDSIRILHIRQQSEQIDADLVDRVADAMSIPSHIIQIAAIDVLKLAVCRNNKKDRAAQILIHTPDHPHNSVRSIGSGALVYIANNCIDQLVQSDLVGEAHEAVGEAYDEAVGEAYESARETKDPDAQLEIFDNKTELEVVSAIQELDDHKRSDE